MIHSSIFSSLVFTALIGLCLGSFLHALAHRIAFEKPLFRRRSHCPHCDTLITWYHNIPVISWLTLGGRCHKCKSIISWIYPCVELITAIGLIFVWHYMPLPSVWSKLIYSMFVAALVISTATDLHTMTIPQVASLWVAPVGIAAAVFSMLRINTLHSILGAVIGYISLWLINMVFKKIRGMDGIGIGDMELFCMIGAFIGPLGLWHTLLIASISGSIVGGAISLFNKQTTPLAVPFGPFLALGALCHLFFAPTISWLLGM